MFTVNQITKLTLILISYIFLILITKSVYAVVPIILVTLITYNITFHVSVFFKKYIVFISICFLIGLNWTGLIPTLAGNAEGQAVNNYSFLFLAFPFYILSSTAFISDFSGRHCEKVPSFLDCALYLSLPFKLLSGPIESTVLIKQFTNLGRTPSSARFIVGFTWMTLGLFMKFVIANRLNPIILLESVDPVLAIACAFVFELKFYFDFAGYSFIVFGMSKWFNLTLTCNFNHPFMTGNVVQFWRSWHISLGRFLQKHILLNFIHKFKSRTSKAYLASFIFVISAMWHGGTLNYLLWGVFHGLVYFIYIQYVKHTHIPKLIGWLGMLIFFIFGRMIAIETSIERLIIKLHNIFNVSYYVHFVDWHSVKHALLMLHFKALLLAMLFIGFEVYQVKIQGKSFYHSFRRPLSSAVLFVFVLLFGFNNSDLLYARI